ncbi:MAG: TlpA family protein disulfide reductase [Deltaproteobacteria bacterium]|nr:TlpA family protein disulfide reductase [Deltaproteobacteria bacterium]
MESVLETRPSDISAASTEAAAETPTRQPNSIGRIARLVGPWLLAGFALYLVAGRIAGTSGPPPGQVAPALAVTLSTGEAFNLAEHRGGVVVLNFWATWCPACRAEAPQLASVGRRLSQKGVPLVGLSVDHMPLERVAQSAQELGMDFPIAMADEALAHSFSVDALPTTVVIGKDGRVAQTFVGGIDPERLEDAVDTALAAD